MRRSIMQVIGDLRRGRTQDELTDKLSALVKAVQDNGRSGTLTLTLKVSPAAKDSPMVTIDDMIVCKSPEPSRAPTLMYAQSDGTLTVDDPNAEPKPSLRSVEASAPELRDVANG